RSFNRVRLSLLPRKASVVVPILPTANRARNDDVSGSRCGGVVIVASCARFSLPRRVPRKRDDRGKQPDKVGVMMHRAGAYSVLTSVPYFFATLAVASPVGDAC